MSGVLSQWELIDFGEVVMCVTIDCVFSFCGRIESNWTMLVSKRELSLNEWLINVELTTNAMRWFNYLQEISNQIYSALRKLFGFPKQKLSLCTKWLMKVAQVVQGSFRYQFTL